MSKDESNNKNSSIIEDNSAEEISTANPVYRDPSAVAVGDSIPTATPVAKEVPDETPEPIARSCCSDFWGNCFAACLGTCALLCVCCGKVEDKIED